MKEYLNLLYRKLVSIPEDIRNKPSIQIICSVKNYFHKMASVLIFFQKEDAEFDKGRKYTILT